MYTFIHSPVLNVIVHCHFLENMKFVNAHKYFDIGHKHTDALRSLSFVLHIDHIWSFHHSWHLAMKRVHTFLCTAMTPADINLETPCDLAGKFEKYHLIGKMYP